MIAQNTHLLWSRHRDLISQLIHLSPTKFCKQKRDPRFEHQYLHDMQHNIDHNIYFFTFKRHKFIHGLNRDSNTIPKRDLAVSR